MVRKILLAPLRLILGLPPVYGLTVKSRLLMLLRKAGLYRGPINVVLKAKPHHFGATTSGR